ncbi:MAG: hypothetical protein ACPG1A_07675 [Halioglobus sp.]
MRLTHLLPALVLSLYTAATLAEYEPPRTAGGKPDLNGVWQVINRANFNLEPHPAQAAMQMREGPVVPVPAGEIVALGAVGAVPAGLGVVEGDRIPYQDWALKQRDDNRANWLDRDPEIRCYLPGIPRATYMPFPFQIFHNEDALVFSYEYAGAVRNVALENPGPPPIDSWMGQSWAEWDGDTLVIYTEGSNGQTWLDRAGNFHSEKLKVTERITRDSDHTLLYEATLEDEKVYAEPWTISMPLYKRVGRDAQLMQFNCVEFVEELMYGHLRKERLDRAGGYDDE